MASGRFRANWDRLDRETVRRLQARLLRRYLRDVVVPFSPFYRDLFAKAGLDPEDIRTLDDLPRIPFTTRQDLLPAPGGPSRSRDFIVVPDRSVLLHRVPVLARAILLGRRRLREALEYEYRPVLMTSTTGRSAEPTPFLFTRHDLDNLALAGRRLIEVAGIPREDRVLSMFPYAPHLAFWQAHTAAVSAGMFSLSTGGGRSMGTSRTLAVLDRIQPNVLIGMPTFLYHLLHQAVEEGRRAEQVRVLVLGGEKVPAGMRRKLRALAERLGSPAVQVVATYGFTEAKMAWAECPVAPGEEPAGYHVSPDLAVVEVVDPETGRPVPDGAPGEVVFTPLDARGTVVLRYRTGDVVDGGLAWEPCPHCRRRVPRLVGNVSRRSEVRSMRLQKLRGTLVDFNELEHVLDDLDLVGAWQLEIRKVGDDPLELDRLVMHVEPAAAVSEEQLLEELNRRFAARTELRLNEVRFHTAAEMRGLHGVGQELKELRVVDHRPAPAPVPAPER